MLQRMVHSGGLALLWTLALAGICSGHDAPEGSEWVMADWMFLSFVIFGAAALLAFIVALKAGLLSNLEEAKYFILEIEEEDYYTPDWAQVEKQS
jgi:hypothetical protein